jgi:hypothetical protein
LLTRDSCHVSLALELEKKESKEKRKRKEIEKKMESGKVYFFSLSPFLFCSMKTTGTG